MLSPQGHHAKKKRHQYLILLQKTAPVADGRGQIGGDGGDPEPLGQAGWLLHHRGEDEWQG